MLWLWYKPGAVDPIGSLAWELPYAVGVALESGKKRKEEKRKEKERNRESEVYPIK